MNAITSGGQVFLDVIVEIVKHNVKPTDVSALRLVKCVIEDVITVSRVRLSRKVQVGNDQEKAQSEKDSHNVCQLN